MEKLYSDLGSQQGYFWSRYKIFVSLFTEILFGRSSQVAYELQKIYNFVVSNVTCNITYMKLKKNQLMIFSLNVFQHFRFERFQIFYLIHKFFLVHQCFTNIDYLFWRPPKEPDLSYFP